MELVPANPPDLVFLVVVSEIGGSVRNKQLVIRHELAYYTLNDGRMDATYFQRRLFL